MLTDRNVVLKPLYRLSLAGIMSVLITPGVLAQPLSSGVNLNDGSFQGRVGRELKLQLTEISDDVDIDIDGRLDDAVWSQ
jgi:hypothetical protein